MLRRSKLRKVSEAGKIKKEEKKEFNARMRDFFQEIWDERVHKSEVSGKWLGDTINLMFFHHILPKNNHLDVAFDKENIIILTPKEHAQVENDIYCFEEVNKRRLKLLDYDE